MPFSGGLYWTHYASSGAYTDLVLQGTHYSGSASTAFAHLNTPGTGWIASVEGGYPIRLSTAFSLSHRRSSSGSM
ncbi:hypothetical protein BZM27_53840 [Paraburkholderia steynii]|uniref:Autotransporter domain-containing protein n=1 Tax=Paraburkholderia steynii TaxID=1245441 RepID=A0A4R0XA21_9BURK|nr:hypothetical protein BZM27_53840 [Paraburkholderia steynii]